MRQSRKERFGYGTAVFRSALLLAAAVVVLTVHPVMPVAARDGQVRFDRIEEEHGLSHHAVNSLHQDKSGFLWIGTQHGLNRYDGYQLKVFRHVPGDPASLPSNVILSMAEDADGRLYAGLSTGHVARYDYRNGTFSIVFEAPAQGTPRSVLGLVADRSGYLWAGVTGNGVFRIDPDSGEFRQFRHDPDDVNSISGDTVFRIIEDDKGRLWFGTIGGGVSLLDPQGDRFERFDTRGAGEGSRHDIIWALHQDRRGRLWAGTQSGVNVLDPQTDVFLPVAAGGEWAAWLAEGASAVLEDRTGAMWFGTAEGLIRFDPSSGHARRYRFSEDDPFSLSDNAIISLLEDRSGNIWIGTAGGGVNKFSRGRHKFEWMRSPAGGLRMVAAILDDSSGDLWIGTWRGGLFRYAPVRDEWTHFSADSPGSGLLNDDVTAIREDRDGNLWIGTAGGGLHLFDRRVNRFRSIPIRVPEAPPGSLHRIFALETDGEYLWIGTYGSGLLRARVREGGSNLPVLEFEALLHRPDDAGTILSNYVSWLSADDGGRLWVGTSSGLNLVTMRDDGMARVRRVGEVPVAAGTTASGGGIWSGHESGLFRSLAREGGAVMHDPVSDFDAVSVVGVVEDDRGRLWISSDAGLIRFEPANGETRQFDLSDGLPSAHFVRSAAHRARDGSLYFGSRRGLVRFHPDHLPANAFEPQVVLTGLSIFDEPTAESRWNHRAGVRLSHRENFFSIHFAALDFTAPERNGYRYMLHGYDRAWVEARGQTAARYTGVPPGRYVFHVVGSNNDGVWNEAGITIPITILPPLWKTWWFRLLAFAAGIGIMAGLYRYRVAQLRQMEHLRFRIAGDLHDDIGADLGSIALMSDLVQRRGTLADADRKQVEQIGQAAREMSASLREIVWLVNPNHDSVRELADRMRKVADALLGGIRYSFEAHLSAPDLRIDIGLRRDLLLLFKEIMHNAARHSGADEVTIRFSQLGDEYVLDVSDDGCGFDPNPNSDGSGLESMRRRARQLKGSLDISTQQGQGTAIRLQIPK